MPDKLYYFRVVTIRRGRELAFTPKDEAAFSDRLVAAFPDICFIPSARQDEEKDDWPVVFRRLSDAKSDAVSFFRWRSPTPPATRIRKYGEYTDYTTWRKGFARRHWPRGIYQRMSGPNCYWIDRYLTEKDAVYGWQRVGVEGRKERPGEVAFVKQVTRIVEKVATNKVCMLEALKDRDGPRIATGYNHVWVGHDTLRWAREDRSRKIRAASYTFVPPDE